jgi:lon-related putative ATP-dependent protease
MKKKSRVSTRVLELPPDALRWQCRPDRLGINSMDEVQPLREIIGQDRALRSLNIGLEMQHAGYNIFVTGNPGTGRTTTIKRLLHEFSLRPMELHDRCYVHNFHDPDAPLALTLPAGRGAEFRHDVATFLAELLKSVPAVFESRRYVEQRKSVLEHFQSRQRSVLKDFERKVKERGFEVVQVQGGAATRPEIAPVLDGQPLNIEQLHAKADAGEVQKEEFERLVAQQAELESQMDIVMREMRNIERRAKKSVEELNHKVVVPIVEELMTDLLEKYPGDKIQGYLKDLRADILRTLPRFHQKEEQPTSVLGIQLPREEDNFVEYQVNVVVDNGDAKGAPVIIEQNPRYKNIFGTIERVVDRNGVWRTDFTKIKAGSILKADGGFLVMHAWDALSEPGVWQMLKRALRNRQMEIQPPESGLLGASSALKPEPIDINVKVIMIGDATIYQMLFSLDDDFREIFKIRADFDNEMPNNEQSITSYLSFIKSLCGVEHLRTFALDGVVELIEYGARLSGQQKKLSTRFATLADVIRESDYWASKESSQQIHGQHVIRAIEERIERVKMIEMKIQEMILDGSIMIDTEGTRVGQVNGLSVYQVGENEFGKPSRITARTSVGKAGIINIEREASLSGPTHNKGVLILGGFLRARYAQEKPLDLSASIAFEQSYGGVDGDSASSTEVYAILSSLSGMPLRQDMAVTGSVNQHGDIQPIGGVNLKVEGFYDVCKARGLTGTQGVLIPEQNAKELMLRHDVVEAVRQGEFHVYAVKTIDEGLEILTQHPAGKRLPNGKFTPGSLNDLVDKRLSHYANRMKKPGA